MSDPPFCAPNRAAAPRRRPQPGEKRCELRNQGAYGVEAQFWQSEEFVYS